MWDKSIKIHKTVLRINIKLMFCCHNLTLAKNIFNSPSYSKSCELFLNLIFLKYNPYCGYFLLKEKVSSSLPWFNPDPCDYLLLDILSQTVINPAVTTEFLADWETVPTSLVVCHRSQCIFTVPWTSLFRKQYGKLMKNP